VNAAAVDFASILCSLRQFALTKYGRGPLFFRRLIVSSETPRFLAIAGVVAHEYPTSNQADFPMDSRPGSRRLGLRQEHFHRPIVGGALAIHSAENLPAAPRSRESARRWAVSQTKPTRKNSEPSHMGSSMSHSTAGWYPSLERLAL